MVDYEIAKDGVTQARPEKGQIKSRLDRMQKQPRETVLISVIEQKKIFIFNYMTSRIVHSPESIATNCGSQQFSTV